MANSIWGTLANLMGTPRKRRSRGDLLGGLCGERLEDRALLTARAFDFPDVAGEWDVTVAEDPAGSANITQNGKKVTGTYNITGVGEVTFTDKFSKKNPDSLSGKIKVKDEELGKFTITVTITFPEATGSPTTFTGTAVTPQGTTEFEGTKTVGTSALPKKATDFEDVAGTYNFTISQEQVGTLEGVLNLTQDGKGGKNLHGTITFEDSPPITFEAKFDKKDPSSISGTADIPVPELDKAVKGKLTAQFNVEFDSFGGTATIKHTTPAEFNATLQQ